MSLFFSSGDEMEEEGDDSASLSLKMTTLPIIKRKDPDITFLIIRIPNSVDGTEAGRYVGENTYLERLTICKDVYRSHRSLSETQQMHKEFFSGIARNRSIKAMTLHGLFLGGSITTLSPFFENNSSLQTLEITNCNFGYEYESISALALALSRRCNKKSLKGIKFYGNSIGDEPAAELVRALHGYEHLTYLSLCDNRVGDRGCAALRDFLLSPNTNLEVLLFDSNYIDNQGIARLTNALTNIKRLSLGNNRRITPAGWQVFFACLQTPNTLIEDLDISSNNIDKRGLTALRDCMANNTTLKVLKMCGNRLLNIHLPAMNIMTSAGWPAAARAFFPCLQNTQSSLVHLDLSYTRLGENGLLALGNALSHNSTLTTLDLSSIRAPAIGWNRFFTCFQSPSIGIRELYLKGSNMNITDERIAVLAQDLANNETLETLDLTDNISVTYTGWGHLHRLLCDQSSIYSICASNHTLRSFGSTIPDDSYPMLSPLLCLNQLGDKKETQREKILYYYFRDSGSLNLQKFLAMKLKVLPHAISWIGRGSICNQFGPHFPMNGSNTDTTLLYQLLRIIPSLFEGTTSKACGTKRKR